MRSLIGSIPEDCSTYGRDAYRPDLCSLSDVELVRFAKSGLADAFAELWQRHRKLVYSMVFRIVRHTQDTEDVLQETFLKAFKKLDGFDGRATFSTWLIKIAINSALMLLRRRKRQPTDLAVDDLSEGEVFWNAIPTAGPNPEECLAKSECMSHLRLAVAALPDKLRIALQLSGHDELSIADIAKEMNLSVAATKSRLLRARKRVLRSVGRTGSWASSTRSSLC